MANRADAEGANLYFGVGSTTTYVLPAPPGYWVPAAKCEVWREDHQCCSLTSPACIACQAVAAGCKTNPTDNVNSCNPSGSCTPITFNQPCDWQNNPALLGKTVYVLPLGSHDQDYPFACAAGVLGGNGSLASQQTSATCAGLCPAGFTCGTEATVAPEACPKGHYCPGGTSDALPCPPGYFDYVGGLVADSYCTTCPVGSFCATGSLNHTQCSPGTVAPNTSMATCVKCAAGKYQADGGEQSCVACQPGSYCPEGASAALSCEKGSYSNSTNLTSPSECTKTDVGSFAPTGSAQQTKCSPGTVQPIVGRGACDKCEKEKGEYQAEEGEQKCETCGAGNYSSNVLSCEPCPVGEYCPDGRKREDCPIGTTTEGNGAVNYDDCGCREGTYNNTAPGDKLTCTPCSDDMNCKRVGLSLATVPLPPSRWRHSVTGRHI